jgi:hypothetical protein
MKSYAPGAMLGYTALALIAATSAVALTLSTPTFAQTVPVSCSVSTTSAVGSNQPVTFTAAGGTGSYVWSGRNINITNETGVRFVVTYPNTGTYPITVTSGSDSATCTMSVIGSGTGVPTVPTTPGFPSTGGGASK